MPVNVEAMRVECSERAEHRFRILVRLPQRGQDHSPLTTVLQTLRNGGGKKRMRPDLEKGVVTVVQS